MQRSKRIKEFEQIYLGLEYLFQCMLQERLQRTLDGLGNCQSKYLRVGFATLLF